mmetsp:Transcript_132844/g.335468  ORF Transcript_132844/g.335468 Transcript_132844/m.335468 type:complete len:302 (+) Transcript_132844:229-1134(+)
MRLQELAEICLELPVLVPRIQVADPEGVRGLGGHLGGPVRRHGAGLLLLEGAPLGHGEDLLQPPRVDVGWVEASSTPFHDVQRHDLLWIGDHVVVAVRDPDVIAVRQAFLCGLRAQAQLTDQHVTSGAAITLGDVRILCEVLPRAISLASAAACVESVLHDGHHVLVRRPVEASKLVGVRPSFGFEVAQEPPLPPGQERVVDRPGGEDVAGALSVLPHLLHQLQICRAAHLDLHPALRLLPEAQRRPAALALPQQVAGPAEGRPGASALRARPLPAAAALAALALELSGALALWALLGLVL